MRPPPVPILDQPNPVHIPTSNLLEIHPNIIHPSTPRSPQWSLLVSVLPFKPTYLLTPWCRVLLEKLTGLQLVKKFPAFHGTRRFITALTSVRHLSLSWASPIQSIYPHPIHSYIHTYIHTYIYTYIHTYIFLPSNKVVLDSTYTPI